ncbi:MAG TPA: glycosyltransferase family 39 protein, partial [Longimicrobiales bacterium]|nr:glycosyltransferase family 39 protein [Longimicrobiales bacterium]
MRNGRILLTLAVAAAAARIPFAWQYPNPDISLFSVVGHRLLQGDALYTDVFDIKPPLTFLLYALSEALVGQGAGQIILLGAAASISAMAGCYALAREIEPRAGLVAAFLWLLFSVDVTLEAQHPNGELLANAALVWAVVFVVRSRAAPAGLLFAAATLVKQNTIAVPFVLALLLVGRREWRAPA